MNGKFTPVVDAGAVYGKKEWRPVLGEGPRKSNWRLYAIGKQSIENGLRGVILPSYDFTLSLNDQSFSSSVGACWTNQPQEGMERHFAANAFALPILMYPFLGESGEHWLSPSNRNNMIGNDSLDPDEALDAFDDLNKWVRRNKQFSQEKKDHFLKAETMKDSPLVPGRSVRYFAQNECRDKENDWHLAVTMFTASAYSYLLEQLRWRHQDEGAPRDKNWPNYMIGDPTDPEAALEWHVNKVLVSTKDKQETNAIKFTERREFLDANQKSKKIKPEVLASRFLMVDPASWNIPTYESQVEYMLKEFDPAVTADMIRAACAYRCRFQIPHTRPDSVYIADATAETEKVSRDERRQATEAMRETSEKVDNSFAPSSKRMPPMPETVAEPETFAAGKAGSKPVRLTLEELRAVADSAEGRDYKVKIDNTWVLLADSGLFKTSHSAATHEELEEIPGDTVTVAAAPRDPHTPAVMTAEEMYFKLFPDEELRSSFSPADKEKAMNLAERALVGTDYGAKSSLPADVIDDLMTMLG
jgi:hypothetical protein